MQKILASPAVDADKPAFVAPVVRVLQKLNVSTSQSYRRLLEDVGLPFVPPPPPSVTSYGANVAFNNRQQLAPPASYAPYGMPVPMYDPSLMMSMNALQDGGGGGGWAAGGPSPVPSHLSPLLVGGPQFDQFRSNTLSPSFSPTSDPFNPFASPPRHELRLPGGGGGANGYRRSSARSDRSASGRSTPLHRGQQQQQQQLAFPHDPYGGGGNGGSMQSQLDWQRRQGQQVRSRVAVLDPPFVPLADLVRPPLTDSSPSFPELVSPGSSTLAPPAPPVLPFDDLVPHRPPP